MTYYQRQQTRQNATPISAHDRLSVTRSNTSKRGNRHPLHSLSNLTRESKDPALPLTTQRNHHIAIEKNRTHIYGCTSSAKRTDIKATVLQTRRAKLRNQHRHPDKVFMHWARQQSPTRHLKIVTRLAIITAQNRNQ